jgi:tetratricopeptide (TPR) repeat protein
VTGPPRSDRKVVPRWRSFHASLALGELLPLPNAREQRAEPTGKDELGHLRADYRANQIGPIAADLMGAALVLGQRETVLDVAEAVLENQISATATARRLAERLMEADGNTPAAVQADQILELEGDARRGELRRQLRESPRNALRWTDLARLQTIIGKERHAHRAMLTARGLAPEDRHVLRSAARLAIHRHRPDEARAMLRAVPRTRRDPWLLAVEISAADIAGERSPLIRVARQMLSDGRFADHELSELASVLATLELDAGDLRSSRQLFRQALVDPSENAIAQMTWAAPALGVKYDEEALAQPTSWEARAITARRSGEWRRATQEARRWLEDQPFASRPAEFGSYEAAKGGDFKTGLSFAEDAILANPKEFLLRNNAAFCLLSMDETERAKSHLSEIDTKQLEPHNIVTLTATWGLYHFRSDAPDRGRELYLQAIRSSRNPTSRALATIMLAREEMRVGLANAGDTRERATKLAERDEPDLAAWLGQLTAFEISPITLTTRPDSPTASDAPRSHSSEDQIAASPTPRLPVGRHRNLR